MLTKKEKVNKVLVTGGGGYLGSVLCPFLLQNGYEVVVVENFMYRQTSLAECCADSKFTLVSGDCRDDDLLTRLVPEVDFIVPLAAIVGAPACDRNPDLAKDVNYKAVKKLLAWTLAGKRIVYPMTNSGYGVGGEASCDEDSPLNPVSLYGQTKVMAEQGVLRHGGVSLRFATLFGMSARMRLDLLVNDFCFRAMRDRFVVLFEANFRRNYLHVRDAASTIIWAIDHFEKMKGKPYNIGLPDANLTKWELCERIKTHVPDFYFAEASVGEDPDKRNYICDNSRILSTGWRPKYSLDDGIRELTKGYEILRTPRWGNA